MAPMKPSAFFVIAGLGSLVVATALMNVLRNDLALGTAFGIGFGLMLLGLPGVLRTR